MNLRNVTTGVILKLRWLVARRFFEESLTLYHADTGVVSGALGFAGSYVARRLITVGYSMARLVGSA